ncbi:MAG: hypothetical protein KDA44_23505 [Planctomycetales bacterium]|nr:hypothetical protein [Planctomycetales bacterium]
MATVLLACLTLVGMSRPARADIMLSTDVSSTPLGLTGVSADSFRVTVTPQAPGPNDLSGWFVTLQISPVAGMGSGTVSFVTPVSSAAPSNYVFGNLVTPGIDIQQPTSPAFELYAQDGLSDANDAVTVATTVNLLSVPVAAEAGAIGLFEILAVRGVANTGWADDVPASRAFSNIAFGSGAVRIGLIDVTAVPEAAGWLLPLVPTTAAGGLALLRRRSRAANGFTFNFLGAADRR